MTHFPAGLDLFNRQQYFAAHEEWEADWHAAGRRGNDADFLKALIHLAAAGVKFQQNTPAGVRSHASAIPRTKRPTCRAALNGSSRPPW